MRKILVVGIKETDVKKTRRFTCMHGCGCVWKSDEYTVKVGMGKKYRYDTCPQCGSVGINRKSSHG